MRVTRFIPIFTSAAFLVAFSSCTEEASSASSAADMLEGTGASTEDFGNLAETTPAEVSPSAIEGRWFADFGSMTMTVDFNLDGTVNTLREKDGENLESVEAWAITGNMLLLEDNDVEPLEEMTCTENIIVMNTVAIVEDTLYMDVYIRTSGSGEGLDGTWESYSGEQYTLACDDETQSEFESRVSAFIIDGATFTETLTYRDEEFSNGEAGESGEGTEAIEGTIETDGMFIGLMTDDPSGPTPPVNPDDPPVSEDTSHEYMNFARVSDNILVVIWPDLFETPEAALAAMGMAKL